MANRLPGSLLSYLNYLPMRKTNYLLMLLIIILGSCASLKQSKETTYPPNPNYKDLESFNNDTLEYVKANFYENQEFYVGKPLKVLFDDLEARIVSFTISSMINPIEKSDGVSLTIRYTKYEEEKTKYMKLIIKFDQLYDYDDALELYDSSADPNWGEAQEDFYKDFIVKEIFIYVPEENYRSQMLCEESGATPGSLLTSLNYQPMRNSIKAVNINDLFVNY